MVSARLSIDRIDRVGPSATANPYARSSIHQHQPWLAVRPLALPVAANDQFQDRPHMRAGIKALTFTSRTRGAAMLRPFIPHWLGFSSLTSHRPASRPLPHRGVGQHSPAARHCAERGAFHSVRYRACKPFRAYLLPVEQFYQSLTHRDHLSAVLSNPTSLAGSKTSCKRGQSIGNSEQVGAA